MVPTLTGLQLLILSRVVKQPGVTGEELREVIAANKVKQSQPGFSQFMSRLVRDGLVFSSRGAGFAQPTKYRASVAGAEAVSESLVFYFLLYRDLYGLRRRRSA